ncbi:hypothetical protein FF011L_36940 [Roseimaritima multifibrata]|uniref:Lipoprotein n=1 Tax=Roseimaritima multifibrata TaxID=1930274 RepID=A0A517MJ35_9BACT|nr:hypothetical protein FF011L_36940 [Roseimaritima multifibrata]
MKSQNAPFFLFIRICIAAGIFGATGCVGLNIPSVRYHETPDPGPRTLDEALLFSKTSPGSGPNVQSCGLNCSGHCEEVDCGPDSGPAEKLPEVPWPRFHPVPTHPVYQSGLPGAEMW